MRLPSFQEKRRCTHCLAIHPVAEFHLCSNVPRYSGTCLDCDGPVTIDKHGRCMYCGSSATCDTTLIRVTNEELAKLHAMFADDTKFGSILTELIERREAERLDNVCKVPFGGAR